MSLTKCAIDGCPSTVFNKRPGVTFHSFPTISEVRRKEAWLRILKNKCSAIDWSKSKICSRHFDTKCFDSQKNLILRAVPTLFPNVKKFEPQNAPRTKIERLLGQLTQSELIADINASIENLNEPTNLHEFVGNDLKCIVGTPTEGQLWLLIKKQDHLITRLLETIVKNKNNMTHKKVQEVIHSKKELERSVETFKYMTKCLQEKQATLEEQIEILSSVESR